MQTPGVALQILTASVQKQLELTISYWVSLRLWEISDLAYTILPAFSLFSAITRVRYVRCLPFDTPII